MKNPLIALALCLFAALVLPACGSVPLALPAPIPITLEEPNMGDIIIRGMQHRGWRMIDQEEGRVRARLHLRTHTVIVDIHYTDSEVTFTHVSSTNLDERTSADGGVTIHRNYSRWLGNLRKDIEDEMFFASTRSGDNGS